MFVNLGLKRGYQGLGITPLFGGKSLGDNVFVLGSVFIPLGSSKAEPGIGGDIVLGYTIAIAVSDAQGVLGACDSLLC